MLTNEIKRNRRKLELLDQEGAFELLFDLIDVILNDLDYTGVYSDSCRMRRINELKEQYKNYIHQLTPLTKFKQINLFNETNKNS